MLLQRLVEYGERNADDALPTGYNLEPVRYWVELDGEGELLGLVPAEVVDGKRPKRVPVPTLVRSISIKPKLLADNAMYALGIAREGDSEGRVGQAHRAFVELVDACAEETGEVPVKAVARFLSALDVQKLGLLSDFDPTAVVGFLVDGQAPSDLPSVQSFWMRRVGEGDLMECLVCGQLRPAMQRIQLKLKGIPGGQSAGLALISANASAFESYGLEASYIAPTCQECSDRFMKAANTLIAGESTHLRVGNTVYIFWTKEDTSFSWGTMLSSPNPDQVRQLIGSTFSGRRADLDPTPFYAAALSASGARAVVRDWIDTTVGRAQQNLARFFQLQELVDLWEENPRPLGVQALARATLRDRSGDDPLPWTVKALIHAALGGGPLPATLLFKAVERCRLEHGVTRGRAALIKMVLTSRRDGTEIEGDRYMVELSEDNSDPAYLCGRLFAELEAAQHAALGPVGATIVDRYYGTASSAPATVFGRLLRGVQPHLAKLHRDRPGAFHGIDRRLEEIMARLDTFPTTLTLEKQGMFALGYYHQRATDHRAAREHNERRDATQDNEASEEAQ